MGSSPRSKKKPDDHQPGLEAPPKVTRYVQPLGPRVLVRIVKTKDRLDSGLFLPEGAKETQDQAVLGEVVEVARAMPKNIVYDTRTGDDDLPSSHADLGTNVSGIPVASQVLFRKDHGVTVPWDDTLRVVDVRHVLAIVDEIPADEMQ
ncbi:MAG: co-chaperone GroES family protein [Nannocystaceae bacterium]